MTNIPHDPAFALIWQRLDAVENKTDGVFAICIALFEHLLDKRVLTIDDVTTKLQSLYDLIDEPKKSSHTGLIVRTMLKALQESNPGTRKKAILELIEGGKNELPKEPH